MAGDRRERVTVDLRGLGPRLQARVAADRSTTASWVRRAVVAQLGDAHLAGAHPPVETTDDSDGTTVKVTVRMSAHHAVNLATRARVSDVSQGAYLASLLEGIPAVPPPPDHAAAVQALIGSTDQLAALGGDINSFVRLLKAGSVDAAIRYRTSVESLVDEVRRHLSAASELASAVKSNAQARGIATDAPPRRRRR